MPSVPDPKQGENKHSHEYEPVLERIKRVQTFIREVLKPANKTLGEHQAQQDEVNEFESRPYQLEAWDALWQAREKGADRGLIHLATGLGKTSIAVFDYARFRNEQEKKGETARALFVVHQNAILDQADERFNEVLPHLLPGVGMSRFSNQSGILPDGEVVFASFQSLSRGGTHKFDPSYFDYIVYDEAHHIEATTYKKVVEYFTPKFQLGLTATPERGDKKDITDHFGEALYTKTLPEGIAEGYLADVHYRLMLDEETKRLIQSGYKPETMAELDRIFDFDPNPEDVAEAIKAVQQELREKTGRETIRTMIFDPDIDSANEIAPLMEGKAYHSGITSKKARDAILADFKAGRLETIVTRDMANEGVNIPEAELIVFRRSTKSRTIFEQQLGRGLRKTEVKDEVTVLDFVANAERIRLIRELAGEISKKRGPGNSEGGGKPSIIKAGKSDFEFNQQIIDILELYEFFKKKGEDTEVLSDLSNEDIIRLAIQLSPDRPLSKDEINQLSSDKQFPSESTIYKRFGSIIKFQRACGFEVRLWKDISNEDIIELAKELSPDKKLGGGLIDILSKEGKFPGVRTISFRFGTLANFQRACGFEVEEIKRWSDLSNDGIVQLAFELSPGHILGTSDIHRLSKEGQFPSVWTIFERFGSLSAFQQACGFEVKGKKNWRDYSNDEIVEFAKKLSPNEKLSASGIAKLAKEGVFPGVTTLLNRFGSLSAFQQACGFEVKVIQDWTNYSNDDIIQLAKKLNPDKMMSLKDVDSFVREGQFPSASTVFKRFGSFSAFKLACGFEST